ncbi:acyltransferase [Alkalinema pantanalense CENA528]|uniref:acyltransferase n=1 Tax=Alkalinema pantanalense TaxID=1620705 RepID=UPI003D6E6945
MTDIPVTHLPDRQPEKSLTQKILHQIQRQYKLIWIHLINLISNFLGNDFIGCQFRIGLLKTLGIQIAKRCTVRGGSYFYGADLILGEKCFINRNCYFDLSAPVILEDNVVIGHGVTFITADHGIAGADRRAGSAIGKPITIGRGAWIGANATLLPGITIGAGSVVAAGAVVTKSIAPNTVVAGVPAKLLRELPEAVHSESPSKE